jgi:hypothetical protein
LNISLTSFHAVWLCLYLLLQSIWWKRKTVKIYKYIFHNNYFSERQNVKKKTDKDAHTIHIKIVIVEEDDDDMWE